MMKRILALSGCVAALTLASASFALEPGGNTIGGPGRLILADAEVVTLVSGLDASDTCVTLDNLRKKGTTSVLVTITDDQAATSNMTVNSFQALSLCMPNAESITATCTGGCAVVYRIDKY